MDATHARSGKLPGAAQNSHGVRPLIPLSLLGSLGGRGTRIRATEMPSVCNACAVTHRGPGLFVGVRQGSETARNGTGASVYAARMTIRGRG